MDSFARLLVSLTVALALIGFAMTNAFAQSPQGYDCSQGLALSGANDQTRYNQTLQSCADSCTQSSACQSFDFGFDHSNICYLSSKSAREGSGRTVSNPRYLYCERLPGTATPNPPGQLKAFDCTGGHAQLGNNDISPTLSGQTLESCQAACDSDPNCKSIDFLSTGVCYRSTVSGSTGGVVKKAPASTYCEKVDDPPARGDAGGGTTQPQPAPADLGQQWIGGEYAGYEWSFEWTRIGTTSDFQAVWRHAVYGVVRGIVTISRNGQTLYVQRPPAGGVACSYKGTLQGSSVSGNYNCSNGYVGPWRASIEW